MSEFGCDFEDRDAGHCAGEVEHLDLHRTDYYACKRHHNLVIRKWHPEVPKR